MESNEGQDAGREHGFFYGYLIVVATFSVMVVMFGTYYAFGVFFKPLLDDFGWSRAMTSGAFSLSSIIQGLLGVAMGWLTDKFGPRIVMTVCGLLLGLGYVLMSQINGVWQLYLFYGVIIGTAMGGSFIPLIATIVRWFVERRSLMSGIVTAGIGIGAMVGPPVASRLISAYDWRVSFTIMGITAFAVVVLAAQLLKGDPADVGQTPYGGNREAGEGPDPGAEGLSFKETVSTVRFWIVIAMFFCFGFCTFAVLVHIVPHVIETGVSASTAANVLATIGGLSIIGKILLGRVADIIGNKRIYIIGFTVISAILFCLVPAKSVWMFYAFAGFFGLAYGGIVASETPIVAYLFGLRSLGLILGVIAVGFTSGGAFGPLATGHIFDVTGSYRPAFVLCAIISLTGLILTLALNMKKTGSH